jgi:hypothetical protein
MDLKNKDIIEYFEGIIDSCNRMTPGNVSHNSKNIIGVCRNIIDILKSEKST